MEKKFRAGDVVKHRPTGETWLLGGATHEYVAPLGWPPCRADAADCEMLEDADDEKHQKVLRDVLLEVDGKRKMHSDSFPADGYAEREAMEQFTDEERAKADGLLNRYRELSAQAEAVRRELVAVKMDALRRVVGFEAVGE